MQDLEIHDGQKYDRLKCQTPANEVEIPAPKRRLAFYEKPSEVAA